MRYKFSFPEIHKHLINIELEITGGSEICLQLPAWRPGRYELSNYGRNLININASDESGRKISLEKTSRESWKITPESTGKVTIKYVMYAAQMDAGGSWVDEGMIYLNFINNIIYQTGKENAQVEVSVDIPADFRIACGLPFSDGKMLAKSVYQILDSPLLAAPDLTCQTYEAGSTQFNIWSAGYSFSSWSKVTEDFRKFSEYQIKVMGEFPEKDYHFMNIFLPYRFHHGVEHANSTMIVLGEGSMMETKNFYDNFLGISSHELFHAWNICKIRPAEMLPYDFTRENYFRTGFVAEGFTTYYGDLFLVQSGVYSIDDYFAELNMTFKRHFENFGRFNYSISDSSYDLWIDGYVAGVPDRKVSIYVKGCVLALLLDLKIRKASSGAKSLDDVMRTLYYQFAKKGRGYKAEDIRLICESLTGNSFKDFFEGYIEGIADETNELRSHLEWAGCLLEISNAESGAERIYGLRTTIRNNSVFVAETEPGSPADRFLAKDDEILEIDGEAAILAIGKITGSRNFIEVKVRKRSGEKFYKIQADALSYFKQYRIRKNAAASTEQRTNFSKWLNQPF